MIGEIKDIFLCMEYAIAETLGFLFAFVIFGILVTLVLVFLVVFFLAVYYVGNYCWNKEILDSVLFVFGVVLFINFIIGIFCLNNIRR